MQKGRVNWTLDQDIIEGVRQKAKQISEETGVDVSASAAANVLLRQALTTHKSTQEEIEAICKQFGVGSSDHE